MSESTDLVRELVDRGGLNYADIGQALGRDRSLIRQVGVGSKPGNNLRDALAELRDRLAGVEAGRHQAARAATVPAPPRRQTAGGRPARVRHRTAYSGPHYTTTTAKRQGARNGATAARRALGQVDGDREVAVTASFDKSVSVQGSSGGRRSIGGAVDLNLGTVEDVLDALDATGLSLSAYAVQQMEVAGYVSGGNVAGHLEGLEVRTF